MLLPFILGFLIRGQFGLGVDEAHYMLYARFLDLSYFDHPPLVGWVHFLFNWFLGETILSARLPALVLGSYSILQVFRFLRGLKCSETASLFAAVGMGLTLQFFVLHLFLLPETLLIACFWLVMKSLQDIERKNGQGASWFFLGLSLGLSALAKYTAIFFILPVAVCLIQTMRFSFLKQIRFYVGVLVALLMILPILIWNYQHDWISFKYQLGHVAGGDDGTLGFLKSLVLQVVIYGPLLWPISIIGLFQLSKRNEIQARFAFWLALTFAAFFISSSFKEVVLPHWSALFYLVTLPFGIAWLVDSFKYRTFVKGLVILNSFVPVFIGLLFFTGFAWTQFSDGLKEVVGWPQVMKEVQQRLQPGQQVAFLNWTYGSRALYYGPEIAAKIFILDDRYDQFDLWNSHQDKATEFLLVEFSFDKSDEHKKYTCKRAEGLEDQVAITHNGKRIYDILFKTCILNP